MFLMCARTIGHHQWMWLSLFGEERREIVIGQGNNLATTNLGTLQLSNSVEQYLLIWNVLLHVCFWFGVR